MLLLIVHFWLNLTNKIPLQQQQQQMFNRFQLENKEKKKELNTNKHGKKYTPSTGLTTIPSIKIFP